MPIVIDRRPAGVKFLLFSSESETPYGEQRDQGNQKYKERWEAPISDSWRDQTGSSSADIDDRRWYSLFSQRMIPEDCRGVKVLLTAGSGFSRNCPVPADLFRAVQGRIGPVEQLLGRFFTVPGGDTG